VSLPCANIKKIADLAREGSDSADAPQTARDWALAEARRGSIIQKDLQMSFGNWSLSDIDGWTCVACTYVNTSPLHLICEVCSQKRPDKATAHLSQKVVPDMSGTSMQAGQHDFLKRQQAKIEEMEARTLAAERAHEIMEIQDEVLEDYDNEDGHVQEERFQTAQTWIGQSENVRQQEREYQQEWKKL
jgi:hypothetical protein